MVGCRGAWEHFSTFVALQRTEGSSTGRDLVAVTPTQYSMQFIGIHFAYKNDRNVFSVQCFKLKPTRDTFSAGISGGLPPSKVNFLDFLLFTLYVCPNIQHVPKNHLPITISLGVTVSILTHTLVLRNRKSLLFLLFRYYSKYLFSFYVVAKQPHEQKETLVLLMGAPALKLVHCRPLCCLWHFFKRFL